MKREEFCPNCEEYRETNVVEREETYTVRDRKITVPVKVKRCSSCGGSIASDEADQEVLNTVYAEFRRQADLLTPEQIKDVRKRYRLSQKSFAALLGMSEATINRYEQGALQDPAHDTAIRGCEKPEIVRELLRRRGHLMSEWQRTRTEAALAGQARRESGIWDLIAEADWGLVTREVSDRTGFRRFDLGRFASAAVHLCSAWGQVSRTTINKLLFYVDFLNFKTATVSLTGTAYRRVQFGPVPSDYDILLDSMVAKGLLACREVEYPDGRTGFYYSPGPTATSLRVEFTAHEQRVLEHVATVFRGWTAKRISDQSHQESAWRNTSDGQLITYRKAQELSLSLPE